MAILLVHLRRIILLLSIVYFGGAFVRKLLTDSRRAHLHQLRKTFPSKHLHFQAWAYIYTGYAYVVLVNYFSESYFTNIFDILTTAT
ncbi:uncharacterized protein LOC129908546 [Episyrphus balteatus]|uniref:uncharacterized protein LOC129908546 n=1 Tax=Episyrphus balteatus TaxID=286459 RepID=UPI002485B608|nr:uncharacterized protein LOC129908546 [Episyrphus balteatus]XP_055841101.1 uncharacterized protein LOC129908546 [Episyrphus balteatus]